VAGEETENVAADVAPCANSKLTLKERMAKLDDMEQVDRNQSTGEETDDNKA
jgi:hypothetical protein